MSNTKEILSIISKMNVEEVKALLESSDRLTKSCNTLIKNEFEKQFVFSQFIKAKTSDVPKLTYHQQFYASKTTKELIDLSSSKRNDIGWKEIEIKVMVGQITEIEQTIEERVEIQKVKL